MRFSEEILKNMFEEAFSDEVESIYGGESSMSFVSEDFSMKYNFLEGNIVFSGRKWMKIGIIFISEYSIFSKIDSSSIYGYRVGLFEHKLKKLINSSRKKARRKFTAR